MSLDFYRTQAGRIYFESTLPRLIDQLDRLNTNLEAIVGELRRANGVPGGARSNQPPHADTTDEPR